MPEPDASAHRRAASVPIPSSRGISPRPRRAVRIPVSGRWLDADLVDPAPGWGLVLFAHGSGSGRKSPRNRRIAEALNGEGLGTLLLDLLTETEAREDEATAEYRFNIPLLTERLLAATDWLEIPGEARSRPLGYFGASTGGAVALLAAAERPARIGAAVLRGARSDLGDSAAARVQCPTLLLAGENDPQILEWNRRTLTRLQCEKSLVVIPRASHLFEEPGAMEAVARETTRWFDRYLGPSSPRQGETSARW